MTRRLGRVTAVEHGIEILRMYREQGEVLSVSEMARRLSVHSSTASRLAATLHASGFLTLDGQAGRYRLGPELIRLGNLAKQTADIVGASLKHLRALCELSGETGHIGLLDGNEVVTAAVVDGWETIRMHNQVGKRSPAYCSSLGKCLLSGMPPHEIKTLLTDEHLTGKTPNTITTMDRLDRELESVRELGFALDREELEIGLVCVSAPIFDAHGEVIAALGLSGPASRLTESALVRLSAQVKEAAARATADTGGARGT